MGPSPAVAEIRTAVRESLRDLDPADLVLVACSGGADSLALAAALAFVAPHQRLRAGGVTVDHGLQPGSAERARAVAQRLTSLGLDPVECVTVTVPAPGAGPRGVYAGPEAAARAARYQALEMAAQRTGAAAVLLGHTLDDQAETVLLGLARGSGARALAGMAARRGRYRRPLLPVRRQSTRAACAALGLPAWDDPHNADSRFSRARVRHEVLPALEAALGPGVTDALARTARQLRADADYLDAQAAIETARAGGCSALRADSLATLPAAIRARVLRAAAITAGCPAGSLTARHVEQLEALVTGWRGQRWIDLPGGVRGARREGQLRFTRDIDPAGSGPAGSGPMAGGAKAAPGRDREGGHGRR
jgi:tRNA(Ile)-lysidine synthase